MSTKELIPGQAEHVVATAARRAGHDLAEGLLWVLGATAVVVGLVILFAPADQYVGLGGDVSWPVGDLHPAWGYGLGLAGVLAVAGAATMTMRSRHAPPVVLAGRAEDLAVLLTHLGVFVIVNLFVWLQDIAIGDGVDYAYWITAPWAVGLLAHVTAYLMQRRRR